MSFLSFLFFPSPPPIVGDVLGRPTGQVVSGSFWLWLLLEGKKLAGVDTEIAERLDVVNSRRQSHKEKEGKREE